jgi:para-aminobenzoate synthetase component 1
MAIGYIGYEATLPFLGLTSQRVRSIPDAAFNFYHQTARFDHNTGEYLNSDPISEMTGTPTVRPRQFTHETELLEKPIRETYLRKVEQIMHHIHEGDIYQANYTSRFVFKHSESPFDVYCRLRQLNPAPYSAFVNFGSFQILSSSPERMFLRSGGQVTTGPIKGTISRGTTSAEEETNRRKLLASVKDRAELLMIVDLERNDLGRIAGVGSVHVDDLFRAESYSSVIHLVSDISARLKQGTGYGDLFRALLPGGSITGAPKKRAVEILAGIEANPRSVYTGAIGYIEGNRADFNVAIRTMVHSQGKYYIHAGGGIVADSDPHAEYSEMLLKARNLLRSLGADDKT